MKRINKIEIIIPAVAIIIVTTLFACNKLLDKSPVGVLSPNVVYTEPGVQGILIGAYSLLDGEGTVSNSGWGSAASNWVYGSVCADEAYKGSTPDDQQEIYPLERWEANSTNGYPSQKWSLCFGGVQRANEVLRALAQSSGINEDVANQITAQARFLRGFFEFEAKKVFGNVPYIDETVVDTTSASSVSNVSGGNYVNVWPQIEADFQFAADNLQETWSEIGRVNKWAATAFLAKAYMYQGKYTDAKPLLDDIIKSGKTAGGAKYTLVNYFDNFNPDKNHIGDAEAVFQAQMSVNDGSAAAQNSGFGVSSGNYGDALNFPNTGGPTGCCGFFNPSQTMANCFKTGADGLPLLDTYNSGAAVDAQTSPYSGTLDPRIDLVMGRPSIPYFDYGVVPVDNSWIRNDKGPNGRFVPKKNVYSNAQKGKLTSNENYWAANQLTANNVNLIRYADVLLWAAECEVRIGDPSVALGYVNQIRNRAAQPSGWVYTYIDNNSPSKGFTTTPAANYNIKPYPAGAFSDKNYALKAILFERRLDFALEGQRFFELQRLDNGTGSMATALNAYAAYESQIKNCYAFFQLPVFIKGKSELFPIPLAQIDILNASGTVNLKQNPGY